MKIAYIGLRGVPAEYSGIERAVEEIGTRLVDRGHEVTVYCMASSYLNKREFYRGIRLRYIPTIRSKNLEMICYAALSSAASVRRRYDITHYHALGPATMAWMPRLLARKTVATVHGLDWQRDKWGRAARTYLRMGEWSAHCLPHRTIVVSKTLKQYFKQKRRRPTDYIPNGMNPAQRHSLQDAAQAYGLQAGRYLLFVGRLTKEKNVHVLIDAFRRVRTDMKLVIVGGSSHTDGYVESLHQAAAGDQRIVLTGPVYGQRLPELYSNPYLFVLPSSLEGLPVVLLEALSYGNAVLVSDIPENVEVIDRPEGLSGFTFETGNVATLAAQLQRLIDDPAAVQSMRARGQTLINGEYDWDAVTDQTESLYHELVQPRRPIPAPHLRPAARPAVHAALES